MIAFNYPDRWYSEIKDRLQDRLDKVYTKDMCFEGPECWTAEKVLREKFNRKHAFLVTSGTAAIQLMLLASGVEAYDRIVCINYSCPATVMPIKVMGAVPVFCDIDRSGQQSLDEDTLIRVTNSKPKAILATGLYGDCYDHDAIKDLGLPILNDSAQSYGAKYKGVESLTLGDMSIISFSSNKPCPIFGTYGAVLCDDNELANKIRVMRRTGYGKGEPITQIGINAQPQEDKASQIIVSLSRFETWQTRRQAIHTYYDKEFEKAGVSKRPSPDYSETNYPEITDSTYAIKHKPFPHEPKHEQIFRISYQPQNDYSFS